MATMIISEKNKAAQAIADALGPAQSIKINKNLTIYQVGSSIYVIPLRGHIQEHDTSEEYEKWNTKDPREIITNPNAIIKKPTDYAGTYISTLIKYAKICDTCIIGTDADIEGCTIGLIDAFPFVRSANPKIKVMQLWLNDLQKQSIQAAYNQLIPPKWNWAESGEARAIIDAFIGFSTTREISLTLHPILMKINVKFVSIGRVQTSLLYLLYLREEQIRNFNPTPFWAISAKLLCGGQEIMAYHMKNNFADKAIANQIFQSIRSVQNASIQTFQQTQKVIPPPTPLNTSDALQLLTSKLGLKADQALKILEELYLNKIISYPRTDSDVYPPTFDHLSILKLFLTHSQYGPYTKDRFHVNKVVPRQGHNDTGDHTPITPLMALELNSLLLEDDLQRKVYDLIARHYLALFGDPATEMNTKILLLIGIEPFQASLSSLMVKGFLQIAPFLQKKYDPPLTMANTQTLPVKGISNDEKQTQPPPRYTDSSLLKLMEQKNLGTKSTRPSFIKVLIDRQYIERKAHSFYVMDLGFLLIDQLKQIWLSFLDPSFTATIESKLEEIQKGTRQKDQIITESRTQFLDLFDKFRAQKGAFVQSMQTLEVSGNKSQGRKTKTTNSNPYAPKEISSTAKCPKCHSSVMKLVIPPKKKPFIVCADPNCKNYLSLPQKGKPQLLKTLCNICKFNIVKMHTSVNKHKFEYYLCPHCWTSAFQTKTEGGFCSKCVEYSIQEGKCVKK